MTALSKRLLITLVAAPLLLHAGAPSQTSSAPKKCDFGCPWWGMEEFENLFHRPFGQMNSFSSASSMSENEKSYLITIDLPGMDKKDISIETSGNRLSVSGERKDESETKESAKRSYRQFKQSYTLPDDANLDAISATSTNGVLKITVPKTGKKVSKKIEIK